MMRMQDVEVGLRELRSKLRAVGEICTPAMSLREAIGRASTVASRGTHSEGSQVVLAPGVWDFTADGLAVTSDHVVLVALVPGTVTFRRQTTGTTSPMLTLSGNHGLVSGVVFDDSSEGLCIKVSGNYTTVQDCRFDDSYYAIEVDGSSLVTGVAITDNLIVTSRCPTVTYGAYSVEPHIVIDNAAYCSVSGNRLLTEDTPAIYATPASSGCSFVGNIMTSGLVLYPTGVGNVDAGNQPAATAY